MRATFPSTLIRGLALASLLLAGANARAELVLVAGYVPAAAKPARNHLIPGGDRVCTQEVKACPDGSYVGRNPAEECRFKPCPGGSALN